MPSDRSDALAARRNGLQLGSYPCSTNSILVTVRLMKRWGGKAIFLAPLVVGAAVLATNDACAAELFVEQIGGVGNLAHVHQTSLSSPNEDFFVETNGLVGHGLSAWLLQAGDLNVMLVRQIGQQNYVGSLDAQQIGTGNFASLIQINSEAYPIGGVALPGHNRLDLLQHGENNIGYLTQRGTNNLMLGVQHGTSQNAEIAQGRSIPSNFNQAGLVQFGNGNNALIWQD